MWRVYGLGPGAWGLGPGLSYERPDDNYVWGNGDGKYCG